MSTRHDIQWLQAKDKFITWGTEISLYQVVNISENCNPPLKISNTCGATLLTNIPHVCYIKCVNVCPRVDNDTLLAIAQSNGKILVTSFGSNGLESQSPYGRELASRYLRQCNAVSWNPIDYTLVGGFDRHRSDHCIVLWDILKSNMDSIRPDLSRPIAEFGVAELATSLSWFQNNNKTLVAGMNGKNLKIIDFRDTSKAMNTTTTKAVYGVTVDPRNDVQLASYSETVIHIWDTRNFDKPLISLPSRPLNKLSWCPTKPNLLSALHKDSSVINLYDVQHTVIGNEEIEPSVLEREIRIKTSRSLSSFSWHDTDEYRLLTISSTGCILEYTVMDRITLNWAPNSNIVWTYGRNVIKSLEPQSKFHDQLDDISQKMKERARNGYGLEDELCKNGQYVEHETVTNVWNWLNLSKRLVDDGLLKGLNSKHPGIRDILKLDPSINKSEAVATNISDISNSAAFNSIRVYRHEDRAKALQMCGWQAGKSFLDNLPSVKDTTRAAAIAVFNLKIRLAIDILNKGAESSEQLNVVAMALAGFSDDKNSMWRQFCSSPKMKLQDPYLRAMFAFLTAENYNYDLILFENDIPIEDRVAFGCVFLSDQKLYEYLKTLNTQLISAGNLDGMLLTGNNMDGIKLLQKYLDITGDIQTTALVAVRAFSGELVSEIQDWVSSYRNLLDSWKLWNERARFDIMFTSQNPNDKPSQQVYVSCNFCGKSISAYMQGLTRGRAPFPRMGGTANKLKMSACPNCRKPLPRCVICLMHMGTTTGQSDNNGDSSDIKLAKFANWFTWCQTCRHGGHASHMVHWFKEHSECPVTACTCRCFSMDSVGN